MECAEIRSSFVDGRVPEGAAVDEHLQRCPHCRELFERDAQLGRRLALAVGPAVDAGDLFALVDRDLAREVGLRARLRALPTRVRGAILGVGVLLSLLVAVLLLGWRGDFEQYSPALFWGVVATLVGGLSWGALRLVRGATAPLDVAERDRAVASSLLVLPALVALVAPLGAAHVASSGLAEDSATAWSTAGTCFGFGAASVVPLLVLMWMLERRDSVPVAGLVSMGALAGVAANLILHLHCASAHLGHLLLGHASIGLAWALGLRLFAGRLSSPT